MPAGHPPIAASVLEDLARLDIQLDASALTRLSVYLDLLLDANRKFNLTAIRDRDTAWTRHIVDSLTLLPFLAGSSSVIDVGSGGGLPGIPLALVRPEDRMTLLEATGKKARFLEETKTALGLERCTVIHARAEEAGQDRARRERHDAAVCRAVGPMRQLLEYAMPLVRVGGSVLAMKASKAEEELSEASDALDILGAGAVEVYDAYPQGFESRAVVVVVRKERSTPRRYPRRPGVPKKEPL